MSTLITLAGIDQAIAALELKPGTLKAQLAETLRGYFPDEIALQEITAIPTDELVARVYGVNKPNEIKAKKKNFSSLKSGLNKNLRDLDDDHNPEGIIIGRDNTFIVSDERKDNLIRQMGLAAESTQTLREMFQSFKSLFNEYIKEKGVSGVHDLLKEFDETRKLIEGLGGGPLPEITPPAVESPPLPPEGAAEAPERVEPLTKEEAEEASAAAEPETLPEEEVEVVDADELEELAEEALPAEDVAEVPEETVEELGEDLEVVEADELEEVEEAPAAAEPEALPEEAIEELGEDLEVVEADELEEVEEAPAAVEPETLPGEEVEVVEADELEELAEEGLPAEDVAEVPEEAVEELGEDLEVVEADELEEVEEAPAAVEPETLPGEEVEVVEADELEEVAEEALPEGDVEEVLEEAAAEPAEDLEVVEADELEEVEEAPAAVEPEALPEEEVEVVEADELEEVAEEALPEGDVEEVLEDEVEELAEEDSKAVSPLEILSKYLEADEATAEERDYLKETDEEYAGHILNRFMPKFVHIPAGEYLIGSTHPKGLEMPQRRVRLPAYYLGQFPVTNDLFDLFVRETGYETEAETAGYGIVFEGRCMTSIDPASGRATVTLTSGTSANQVAGACWRHPQGPKSSIEGKHLHPVVQVSHNDAMAFAAWAGKRLPIEEEWEAAARGRDSRLFPWGDLWLAKLANLESSCTGDTVPVDRYGRDAMSPFGIHDLLGNIYEWTATIHQRKGGKPATGTGVIYILKGGCWTTSGMVSIAHREIERGNYWSNTIGFRCAV